LGGVSILLQLPTILLPSGCLGSSQAGGGEQGNVTGYVHGSCGNKKQCSFDRKTDDKPWDYGVTYFQTRP